MLAGTQTAAAPKNGTMAKTAVSSISRTTDGSPANQKPMLAKIAQLREMVGEREIHIEIDGGVVPANAGNCAAMGADVLVAGSGVFKGGSVAQPEIYGRNIRAIREAAEAVE